MCMKRILIATMLLCFPLLADSATVTVNQEVPSASSSIPKGAQRIPMMRIALSASCDEDVTLTSLTLTHRGLGAAADLSRIYILEGQRRISRAHSISSKERTVDVRLRAFTIKRCTTRTIDVLTDFSADASVGAMHALSIVSANDVHAGDADIELQMLPVSAPAVTVPASSAVVEVEYLPLLGSVTYGANRTLARIKLTGDGDNQHITRIVLTNDGSARDTDLLNLSLETSRGEEIANVLPHLDGSLATFELNPAMLLEDNQTKMLLLKGDVRASRRRTIRFIIEEPSDILAEIRRGR